MAYVKNPENDVNGRLVSLGFRAVWDFNMIQLIN